MNWLSRQSVFVLYLLEVILTILMTGVFFILLMSVYIKGPRLILNMQQQLLTKTSHMIEQKSRDLTAYHNALSDISLWKKENPALFSVMVQPFSMERFFHQFSLAARQNHLQLLSIHPQKDTLAIEFFGDFQSLILFLKQINSLHDPVALLQLHLTSDHHYQTHWMIHDA